MTSPKRILIVGGGGREHALAWRCRSEGHEVHVAPGNPGIAEDATCHPVAAGDIDGLLKLAMQLGVDLVLIGPEKPLVDGLADRLQHLGIPTVGPSSAAAELEGSKAAAKAFMARHGIPTAAYRTVAHLEDGLTALKSFEHPPVVKASGLAGGKGVTVPDTFEQAEAAVRECLDGGRFGVAGSTVVLEERLYGQEVSLFIITDGQACITLDGAQDHKRLLDGGAGPNTGGMGAYGPAPVFTEALREQTMARIVEPTLAGLRSEGRPFVGVLFVGLILTQEGPYVIEYNCRFGDPETQPLLFGLTSPLVPHLVAAAEGRIQPGRLTSMPAVNVVLAAEGYPRRPVAGAVIRGLEDVAQLPDVKVFHAGTARDDADGKWRTAGGRVVGVCAKGSDLASAIKLAYEACEKIEFEGMQRRSDIGVCALTHTPG
ncbi:MAG: phosphoribosylamine--glycine ligase [Nannocystaceae bacterium]